MTEQLGVPKQVTAIGPSHEISLRKHLANLGWGEEFLDRSGCFARWGVKNWRVCLLPFSRWKRLTTRKKLPIEEIIPVGTRVKFLKSLKHPIIGLGPKFSIFRLFIRAMSAWTGEDLAEQPEFQGWVEQHHLFDQFPFDEWLTVCLVRQFDALYVGPNNTYWTISLMPLVYVTQIEICKPGEATDAEAKAAEAKAAEDAKWQVERDSEEVIFHAEERAAMITKARAKHARRTKPSQGIATGH
ncbi:MAG: hypothetical protein PHR30_08310 [Gallionellaceae bacterium]|nr:hypothetical protein [Gallionellaceae bacterium]